MERVWLPLLLLLWTVPAGAASQGEDDLLPVRIGLDRVVLSGIDPLRPVPSAPDESEFSSRPRLAIARSIQTMMAHVDSNRAVLTGEVLPLLSLARNHANLGLRRRALRWYERALLADKRGDYGHDIRAEMAQVAVAVGDSALITDQLLQLLERADAPSYGATVASLMDALADRPITAPLLVASRRIESWPAPLPIECLRELCRLHERREEWGAAAEGWYRVLHRQRELGLREVGEALKALADAWFLAGERERATSLYELYRQNNTGWLSAWSTYQLGVLASLDGRDDRAIAHFRSLCEREDPTPWRDEACQRLASSERLLEIDRRLRPFGRRLHSR